MSSRALRTSDGGWVAVFTGYSIASPGSPARQVIRARRFNAAGVPMGPDFDVNSSPAGAPGASPSLGLYDFVVAAGPTGRFAVSWTFSDSTAGKTTIRFRSFAGASIPVAPDGVIATEQTLSAPLSAAFDNAGRVLLLWETSLFAPSFPRVLKARLLRPNSTGGAVVFPNSAASGAFAEPFCGSVAWAGNSWLITWVAQRGDLEPSAVFLRRFR